MASVTANRPTGVTYTLELDSDEAELLVALLGRTNSVHEHVSDRIYNALLGADVAREQYSVEAVDRSYGTVITLRPIND